MQSMSKGSLDHFNNSGKLLTTPELQGGSAGNCSKLDMNVDSKVVRFSMGWYRLGLYKYISI